MTPGGAATAIPADVESIENELEQQWKDHASLGPVLRTRSLNLVIVSPEGRTPTKLVEQITQEHPCRVVVLEQAMEFTELHAQVSTSCALANNSANCLVREEVHLLAATLESGKMDSMVVPLLVFDVPVFLWWRGRPDFASDLLVRLEPHSDRVILDSSEYPDTFSGLIDVAHSIGSPLWRAGISDLAWARLTVWRELTAQFFDNRRCAEYLPHIRAVKVTYGSDGSLPADALLFAGWIARQLGWRPASAHGVPTAGAAEPYLIALHGPDGQCRMELLANPAVPPGLHSVQLVAERDEPGIFSIERTPACSGLITAMRLGALKAVQRTIRSRELSPAELVKRELTLVHSDTLYKEVLAVAAEIIQVIGE